MYLIDTNVISEARKRERADPGVLAFLRAAAARDEALYLSVVTIGELRRGIELIRHRGDEPQAGLLEHWMHTVLHDYADLILAFDADAAQVWGRLRVPHPEHELDKQIAAIALVHDLTVVTRNVRHFRASGVKLLNPFRDQAPS
ncbi:type II toxin-antitoxin system VapC family toxin [Pelomonas aquatica]|jgi:predicted nucleic acid-binding protein|uniref:Ribonuclease VapC n=1 Tax=Pelomonas aquatica TaxID=431058 RepID=A0A9X4R6N0_9BURK|nr:type II toxin-antitoxin system VapC family toxin [Pelomonas aquatica]MCY4752791.1 type II toxin-antitoxin system VapC family toxin [Pelomonas aquatica]MDG0864509.1 type II toxin-antitoxin system VapC family toxin [Pelomonas aquatica]